MQKEIFQKLVKKLDEQCECVLIGSEVDYRRLIAKRSVDQVRLKSAFFFSLYTVLHDFLQIDALVPLSKLIYVSHFDCWRITPAKTRATFLLIT